MLGADFGARLVTWYGSSMITLCSGFVCLVSHKRLG